MRATYLRWLAEHPYKTKMVTSGALCFLGDMIQQGIEHRAATKSFQQRQQQQQNASQLQKAPSFALDWPRATRMGAFGMFFIGPLFHNWFSVLEKLLPGGGARAVLGKLAIDQLCMAPAFTVSFFAIMGALVRCFVLFVVLFTAAMLDIAGRQVD